MGFITIFTVVLIAALLAVGWKEDYFDTLPIVVSATIMCMYVLAFFQGLPYLDYAASGILIGIFIGVYVLKKENGKARLKEAFKILFSTKSILLLGVMILLVYLLKDKIALWWDDINYWAVDAKALYYNGGFAGKYGNVAPEFGDYPPGLQLFKWFVMHLSSDFSEGLMFGAYHCLNLIYVLPLLSRMKTKNPVYILTALLGIFLFPGIVDGIAKEGTCADVTMGIVYGAFLWSVYDDKDHGKPFYYSRLILYLCVLVLTKSVGIEWAFFGLVFFVLVGWKRKKEKGVSQKELRKAVLGMTGAVLLTEGSWLLFCLVNRRVAKLTGAGIRIAASGDYSFLVNSMEKIKIYLEGFIIYPMHGDKTGVVDFSSCGILLLFIVVIFLLSRLGFIQKWEEKRCLAFTGLTAFVAYGIIFLGHITIFVGEMQYLDPYVMAKSIARYGAPFTIGLLYLFMGILILEKGKTGYWICLSAVLLTTSLPGAYQTVYGYRTTVGEDKIQRSEMVEDNGKIFLSKIFLTKVENYDEDILETRILYLRDDKEIHWVKDTYISYEAAPVPVVYNGIATDTMTEADMLQKIEESHAAYVYADQVEGDPAPLFAGMMDGEEFQYETIYEIKKIDGAIKLKVLQ